MIDRRAQLRDLYGFDFPDDLFRFWDLARRLRPLEPLRALEDAVGARLCGPFDVLYGLFDGRSPRHSPLLHWRYYLDPPEFFSVLLGQHNGLHWGYYLDDPAAGSGCVASCYADDAFELSVDGDTLFEAVRLLLEFTQRDLVENLQLDLVTEADVRGPLVEIDRVRQALMRVATGEREATGEEYVARYAGRSARRKRVVAATQDGIGIVVPPETYRPLSVKDKGLWKRLWREEDPAELVAEARQALADGFPGTALKLGKDLWAIGGGGRRAEYAWELLDAAYAALGREGLRQVAGEHRRHRDRPWLDVLQPEET
jgi:hypothetical protein